MNHRYPILIAEDNPASRKQLEKILFKAGYNFTAVETGRKALEVFKERFFPIVLTDWMMPEMDGLELCRAIRENDNPGYVFIILLIVKDSQKDIIAGLEAGADDYVTKPFNHEELIARLKSGIRLLELEWSLKEANEKIKMLSITDPLTGCYNRNYFNEWLPKEIKRARRYQHSLSLILCDIDHFKNVNDTYGHLVGDRLLKEIAQTIRGSIRDNVDWLVRYGGEEFVIVLPETDTKGAFVAAQRLRNTISKKIIKEHGEDINITASFGTTGFDPRTPSKKISPEALIKKADKYLYQAKQEGRDSIKIGWL